MTATHHDAAGAALPRAKDELHPAEFRDRLESGAWITLLLAPLLYYVNGPAVSTDQWLMRQTEEVLMRRQQQSIRTSSGSAFVRLFLHRSSRFAMLLLLRLM